MTNFGESSQPPYGPLSHSLLLKAKNVNTKVMNTLLYPLKRPVLRTSPVWPKFLFQNKKGSSKVFHISAASVNWLTAGAYFKLDLKNRRKIKIEC